MNWLDEIKIEELPEKYQEMACIIGIENTIRLAEHFGKEGFYFTGIEKVIVKKKEDFIIKNFNGINHRELAKATGYSERWVYEILKSGRDERQNALFE